MRTLLLAALVLVVSACADDAAPGPPDTAADIPDVPGTDGADGTAASDGLPTDGTDATDGSDGTDGTDATDGSEGSDGTDASDATDGTDGPIQGTGPVCTPSYGYDPGLLDPVADAVLASLGAPIECGCSSLDGLGEGGDAAAEACLCEAFADCRPARLRTLRVSIEGDPLAADLIVQPDGVGGCKLVVLTDWTQDQFGGVDGVTGTLCEDLQCVEPLPEGQGCGPLPECGEPPQCPASAAPGDTDGDGCPDACCFVDCGPDFVATDLNGDGCADSCADAPCTAAEDCQIYQCSFFEGTCEAPEGLCSDFACDAFGPVCGCDGVTYETGCAANAAGVPVASSGACE